MTPRLRTSPKGRQLIMAFEGFREVAAPLDEGGWVVGYGHVKSAREGARVTRDDAQKLLIYDLQPVEDAITEHVFAPLTQNEFDALASLAFNIGPERFLRSDVLLNINEGRPIDAAEAFDDWRMTEFDGRVVVVDALARRRAAEKALFLTPEEGYVVAPTPQVRVASANPGGSRGSEAVSVSVDLQSGSSAPEFAPLSPALEQPEAAPEPAPAMKEGGAQPLEVHVGTFADMPAPAAASPEPVEAEATPDQGAEEPEMLEFDIAMPEPQAAPEDEAEAADRVEDAAAEPEADKPAGPPAPEPVEDVIARIARGMDEEAEEDIASFDDDGEDDEHSENFRPYGTAKATALSGDNGPVASAGPVTGDAPEPPSEEELWISEEKSEIERWRDLAATPESDDEGSSALWYALFLVIGVGLTGFGLFDSYLRWSGGRETALYGPLIAAVGAVVMIGSMWFLVRQLVRERT